MPDLNTKTLNELDTITEMGENDKVLIESGGRMKRCSGSLGGGGGAVLLEIVEMSNGRHIIELTPNELTTMLSSGQLPIFHFENIQYQQEQYGLFKFFDVPQNWLEIDFNGSGTYYYDETENGFLEPWD